MTELLKKAFNEVSRLKDQEQDAIAQWLLQELASEQRWADAFGRSQDALKRLAGEAQSEHRNGATQPLNPDSL